MKTFKYSIIIVALLLYSNLVNAAIYKGTWANQTFGSSGELTINLTVRETAVSGSFDLGGPVFGGGDPASITFSAPLGEDGSGKFKSLGTAIGDIAGTFSSDGTLTITITKIPGGFLSKTVFNGKFDLKRETFAGTYKIYSVGLLFANGNIEAHVHKKPILKLPTTVNVTGTSKTIQATVITNTGIKSFKATTTSMAAITVSGTNPYQIKVTKLTDPTTSVKVTVINTDGLGTTKIVNFVKSSPAAKTLGLPH